MNRPGGFSFYVLVKEFGLTFNQIGEMSHLQMSYLLAGWNKEQEMIEKQLIEPEMPEGVVEVTRHGQEKSIKKENG